MAIKTKVVFLTIFLFILVALCANLVPVGAEEGEGEVEEEVDPELKTCKHQCMQQKQYSKGDQQECIQSCEKYHQMKKERERQSEEQTRKSSREEQEKKEEESPQGEQQEEDDDEEQEEYENPLIFEDDDFDTKMETEDGRVRVLQKFTRRSRILRGIQNFRFATLEAKGHTFISPYHFDSETVIFNVKGRGIFGLVREDTTDRFNLEPGDIMRIPAGTPFYVVNKDENEKLVLAKLLIPVSIPGQVQAFYGPGGRNPESFLSAFSWELLQAALKSPKEKIKELFKQQDKGGIFKISKDHVQALSKVQGGIWPFGGQRDGPFNLLKMRPRISNQHGRLYQSTPDEPTQLKELNLILSFTNITKGCMTAPHYATKATKICMVTDGKGYMEMVFPDMSSSSSSSSQTQGKKSSSPSYHRLSATLRPRMVFVVPAGYPFLIEASNKNNLNIVCFEVNARGNNMFTFAGKRNVVSALDKEAKELAFNYPADKVHEIFNRDENFFFPGPNPMEEQKPEKPEQRADA